MRSIQIQLMNGERVPLTIRDEGCDRDDLVKLIHTSLGFHPARQILLRSKHDESGDSNDAEFVDEVLDTDEVIFLFLQEDVHPLASEFLTYLYNYREYLDDRVIDVFDLIPHPAIPTIVPPSPKTLPDYFDAFPRFFTTPDGLNATSPVDFEPRKDTSKCHTVPVWKLFARTIADGFGTVHNWPHLFEWRQIWRTLSTENEEEWKAIERQIQEEVAEEELREAMLRAWETRHE